MTQVHNKHYLFIILKFIPFFIIEDQQLDKFGSIGMINTIILSTK